MIRKLITHLSVSGGKPRASGDDPIKTAIDNAKSG